MRTEQATARARTISRLAAWGLAGLLASAPGAWAPSAAASPQRKSPLAASSPQKSTAAAVPPQASTGPAAVLELSTAAAVSPQVSTAAVSATQASTAAVPAAAVSTAAVSITTAPAVPARPSPLKIRLVYPREGARLPHVSRSFVFGSVEPPHASVTINGSSVSVHRTGSFIAFIPFSSGDFRIRAQARLGGHSAEAVRSVFVAPPPPQPPQSPHPAVILPESVQPTSDMTLVPGDVLPLRFRGSVRGRAQYRIDDPRPLHGGSEWRPMVERSPGVYEASRIVRPEDRIEKASIRYRLESPQGHTATAESPGRIRIADSEVFSIVEVSTEQAILRTGPAIGNDTMGYDLFVPRGVKLRATGAVGNEVRVKISDSLTAWTDQRAVTTLPEGTPLPRAVVDSIRTQSRERGAAVVLELRDRVPYRVSVSDDLKTLTLTLFYAVSNVDRMRYGEDSKEPLLEQIRWFQPANETVQIQCQLRERLWGYDVRYEGGRLICEIYAPPKVSKARPLAGLKVAVDPGHSPEPTDGAIGPQGVRESEVNYRISLALKDRLEDAGAKVFLTRRADEAVSLPERVRRAHQAGSQIFVSVHANALPDGANPSGRGGFSVFYFQPQSYAFGREVHAAFKESLRLPDDGFYYGNLAVCRATQMPAILTEAAYLILPHEEELLLDPKFQRTVAEAIVRGLSSFLRSLPKD